MKIALCLYKYFPFGGLQRDFLRIAEVLYKRGHQVRTYTRKWDAPEKPNWMDIVIVPVSGITNHSQNVKYFNWVQNHLRDNPVDRVVGFNKMPGLDVYYGADVCYLEKVENEKGFFYKFSSRFKHYYEFEKRTVGRGLKNKLMIITPNQKRDFQKHYQTEDDRFYLLPPGISSDRKYSNFRTNARKDFRQKNNLQDNDFLLLQIGSDFSRKGVDRSIKALAALPEEIRKHTYLYVLGQDNESKFASLACNLKVKNQILFMGGRSDVPDFIAGADLFLHPARSENTGTAILEALVGGLPEIVTDVCGYAPYVEEANSGFVLESPYNQESFNACLRESLDRTKLENWQRNARHFADTKDLYSLPEKAADVILG